MRAILLAVPLLAAGCVASAGAADFGQALVLNAAQIKAGAIKSLPLGPSRLAPTVTAFGAVLDPGKLAAASAKLAAARAAIAEAKARLALAKAKETRASVLFRAQRNISKAQYQQALADAEVAAATLNETQVRLRSEQASIRADWGASLATAVAHEREPIPELITGASCLLRATLPFGTALSALPKHAVAKSPAGSSINLTLVGPSPRSPSGGGPSYFFLGSGAGCPPVGMTVEAVLPAGPKRNGVVVPLSAVVWRGDEPFAFRADGKGAFSPVSLVAANPVAGGYFVPASSHSSLSAGQKVVVSGAGLLLSYSETPPEKPKKAGDDDEGDDDD